MKPGPFGAEVTIDYRIPGAPGKVARVSLCVYDIKGRKVRLLAEGFESSGPGRTGWDGMDSEGRSLPSGVYFIRLCSGDEVLTRKVLLLR
jgi:flagellar hook assembly protein FlgD